MADRHRKFNSRVNLCCQIEAEAKARLIAIAGEFSLGYAIEKLLGLHPTALEPQSLVEYEQRTP